jgi:hypothetical protein
MRYDGSDKPGNDLKDLVIIPVVQSGRPPLPAYLIPLGILAKQKRIRLLLSARCLHLH